MGRRKLKNPDELVKPGPSATIAERLRYLVDLTRKTQVEFGKLINVDPSNMSKILSGNYPITDAMVNRVVVNLGVSKDWLTNGTDVPYPKSATAGAPLVPEVDTGPVAVHDRNAVGAPVYDIDATAGCVPLSRMFTDEHIIGRLDLPGLDRTQPIVRVSGDSMEPKIRDGGYIAIRHLSRDGFIYWGKVYLVITEDYRMVKIVRKHTNPGMVILHSINPEYDDMEIERNQIQALFLVNGVFNYEIL